MVRRDATRYKKTYSYRREEPRTAEDVCAVCNTILNGVGPPADSLGLIDDLYIDTLTMELYGPKPSDAGPWGLPIPLAASGGAASPVNSVQYNGGGYFLGSSAFTFVSGNLYLTGTLAQGTDTLAAGAHSHAEGWFTLAGGIGSHAEGLFVTASGGWSHAEGNRTHALGGTSHAEGLRTFASAAYSHAEGSFTTGSGVSSHAEGYYTVAHGNYSHAEGLFTIASGSGQTVVGKYNKRDNADSLFVVGNGTGDSNANRRDILLVNPDSVMVGSSSIGTDTFFYVGTQGSATTATFAGDTYVSGTGRFEVGLSGSLTQLVDGTSYLRAGTGIDIATGSSGQITISAPDNTYTVGLIGSGARFTSIQAAIDQAVTDAVSATVYIMPGSYTENITLAHGITLFGSPGVDRGVTINGSVTCDIGAPGIGRPQRISALVNLYIDATGGTYAVDFTGIYAQELRITNCYLNGGATGTAGALRMNNTGVEAGLTSIVLVDGVLLQNTGTNTATPFVQSSGNLAVRGRFEVNAATANTIAIAWTGTAIAYMTSPNFFVTGLITAASSGAITIALATISTGGGAAITQNGSGVITLGAVGIASSVASSTTMVQGGGALLYAPASLSAINYNGVLLAATLNAGAGPVAVRPGFDYGTAGQYLVSQGAGLAPTWASIGSPSNSIQYNNGGYFAGDSTFTFDSASKTVTTQNVVVAGDLTVNGAMTTINTVNLEVKDAVIGLGFASGTLAQTAGDRGIIGGISGDDNVTLLWKNATSEFALGRTQSSATGSLPIALSSYSNLHVANLQALIVTASQGFSGSLTTLVDGTSYLREGTGISIVTGSGGWVTITSTAVTSPASPDTSVQFNNAGSFDGDATYTFIVAQDEDANPMGRMYLTGSVSQGKLSISHGYWAHAEGISTKAYGTGSHSEGYLTQAGVTGLGGMWSHAEGASTKAYGDASHAEGSNSKTGAQWNLTGSWSGGNAAHAEGSSTTAFGNYSHTEGTYTKTGGQDGDGAWSGGLQAHAEGYQTTAFGESSHAEGNETKTGAQWNSTGSWSGGSGAHAEGANTIAYGDYSHAEGTDTKTGAMMSDGFWSGGGSAHAEGATTRAFGSNSHAEGNETKTGAADSTGNWSGGDDSHAEGLQTTAYGPKSHAEGSGTKTGAPDPSGDNWAGGDTAHAEGTYTTAYGVSSHTEGTATKTGAQDYSGVWSGGNNAHAEGDSTIAYGYVSHAEGIGTQTGASGSAGWSGGLNSHAEGSYTTAYGQSSHTEGINTKTGVMGPGDVWSGGDGAHAEGNGTIAFGETSHTEGANTQAGAADYDGIWSGGVASHAEGQNTIAYGEVSHTEGVGTRTGASGSAGWSGGDYAHAEGKNTIAYGEASHTEGYQTKTGVMGPGDVWSGGLYAHAEGNYTIAFGTTSHTEGYAAQTGAADYDGYWSGGTRAHAEGEGTIAYGDSSHAEGLTTQTGASGSAGWLGGGIAHAEGEATIAYGYGSHTEGINTKTGAMGPGDVWSGGDYAHAEGNNTTAFGDYSHAEGISSKTGAADYDGNWSGGLHAHAEGADTTAFGAYSHAEGDRTQTGASGSAGWSGGAYAHAEGEQTIAFGNHSHAEGYRTIAIGNHSHAGGTYTIASGSSGQTVVGKYNKRDNADSLFVVGNGDGDANENRSDIFLVNSGSVMVGSASLAPDTFFYVGTKGVATNSRFDGNIVVSGTFDVKDGSSASTLSVVNSMVGINVVPTAYALEVNGEFAATVKSFVINHPNKPGWKLRHGTLEGPENGVYVRGRSKERSVKLPDYWQNLVDETSITVHITPIGTPHLIYVVSTSIDGFAVDCSQPDIEYYYKVQAERKDYTFEVEYKDLS